MPQKISISDDIIKQIVKPDLERAKAWQDELRPQREQYAKLYAMSKDADGIAHLNRDGWSQVVAPLVYESVEGMKVGLDQLFTSPDFFDIKVGEDAEAGDRIRKLVRWNIFEAQYGARQIRFWLDGCLKYHYGVVKCFWDEQYREDTQEFDTLSQEQSAQVLEAGWELTKYKEVVAEHPVLDPLTGMQALDEAGQPVTEQYLAGLEGVKAVKMTPTFIGPRILAVDPEAFYYSPDSDELEKCRVVAHRVNKRLEDIRRGEDAGIYRKGSYKLVLDKLSGSDVSGIIDDSSYRYDVADLPTPNTDDPGAALKAAHPGRPVDVWEIYTSLDIDNDGLLEPVIIHMAGSDVILSVQENPYKRPPFRVARAIESPWKFEGVPYPESLKQLQIELTQQTRMWNDACADSVQGGLITDDAELATSWASRKIGDVMRAGTGTLNSRKFEIVPRVQPDASILKATEMLEGRAERVSGVTRYNQGIDANSLNKTATGIQTIASLAQQRQKYMANCIAECWKDVLEDVVECFKLFGTPYIQYFASKGNKINPQDYTNDFTVTIELGIGPQEKAQQAGVLREMIALAQNGGLQVGLFSVEHVGKMINRIGQLSGIPLESYHYSEEEIQQMQQQKAAQAQQQQQMMMQQMAAQQQQKQMEAAYGSQNNQGAEAAARTGDAFPA